jgi:hypothetical protein
VRICKALLEEDEEWDEGEARRLTEEAWQEDSRGTGALTRTMFNDSLFEVCALSRACPHHGPHLHIQIGHHGPTMGLTSTYRSVTMALTSNDRSATMGLTSGQIGGSSDLWRLWRPELAPHGHEP